MFGSEAAVRGKVLLFGSSCATKLCNSRPTTAYNMPTFWHTHAAMLFQNPYS